MYISLKFGTVEVHHHFLKVMDATLLLSTNCALLPKQLRHIAMIFLSYFVVKHNYNKYTKIGILEFQLEYVPQ